MCVKLPLMIHCEYSQYLIRHATGAAASSPTNDTYYTATFVLFTNACTPKKKLTLCGSNSCPREWEGSFGFNFGVPEIPSDAIWLVIYEALIRPLWQ